jgi:hypothetical protein
MVSYRAEVLASCCWCMSDRLSQSSENEAADQPDIAN